LLSLHIASASFVAEPKYGTGQVPLRTFYTCSLWDVNMDRKFLTYVAQLFILFHIISLWVLFTATGAIKI
jgi:hypothetical protein